METLFHSQQAYSIFLCDQQSSWNVYAVKVHVYNNLDYLLKLGNDHKISFLGGRKM